MVKHLQRGMREAKTLTHCGMLINIRNKRVKISSDPTETTCIRCIHTKTFKRNLEMSISGRFVPLKKQRTKNEL